MRKGLPAICILFVLVSAGFAATPTQASLKGTYSFQYAQPHLDIWQNSVQCVTSVTVVTSAPPAGTTTYFNNYTTYSNGGETVSSEISIGTLAFDGNGNVIGNITDYNRFNRSASNATVVCNSSGPLVLGPNGLEYLSTGVTGGYPVYDAPSTQTVTGTYTVQADGTGAILFPGSDGGFIFILAGSAPRGIRTTILFNDGQVNESTGPNNYHSVGSGTAVLQ